MISNATHALDRFPLMIAYRHADHGRAALMPMTRMPEPLRD
jgi:hypothetical protein